jgi:WD40 repeat protein
LWGVGFHNFIIWNPPDLYFPPAVAVSLDGQRILSGGRDGHLFLWSRKSGRLLCQRSGAHAGGVRAVAFSGDGKRLVSCGNDGAVRWWAANGHAVTPRHQWHAWPALPGDRVAAMSALSADKTFSKVVVGDGDGNVFFLRVMRI